MPIVVNILTINMELYSEFMLMGKPVRKFKLIGKSYAPALIIFEEFDFIYLN